MRYWSRCAHGLAMGGEHETSNEPKFIWLWPFYSRRDDVGTLLRRITPCIQRDKGVKVCLGRSGLEGLGDAVYLSRIHSMHVMLVNLHVVI